MSDKLALDPEKILRYSFAYAPPLMIEAAVRLNVFDALADGPRNLDDLAKTVGTDRRGLRILLNGLAGLELVTKPNADSYGLTAEAGAFLVSSRPAFLGGFFRHTSTQLMPKWLRLTDVVRDGRTPEEVNLESDGAAFFEQFVEDIFPLSRPAAMAFADREGLAAAGGPISVLDVGAGSGVWSVSLAEKSPRVRATAVDWPAVLKVTRRIAERHGVADRFTFSPGDFSVADFGTGHQYATIGHILHSEGPTRSQALLKKVFDALAHGGKVVITEWLVDEARTGPLPSLIFAVNMLVNTTEGDTFSFPEIAKWLAAAGFVDAKLIEDLRCPSPIIVATKP
ncbi:MAG: methyltransferase [Paludisphaera borealis]|uniref:methyltransferase n=1 Tax=Paludisphaera borealis TaxID=1387353 RepID=UPI0028450FDA|nr:methyltransferase [Paludisphaera borealis]MDR3619288.1 methyltransferase [Paludisphaera borealis]